MRERTIRGEATILFESCRKSANNRGVSQVTVRKNHQEGRKERITVLVLVDVHANPKDMSLEELWYIWEKEAKATLEAMEAGKVVTA